jgi:spermidine synthase
MKPQIKLATTLTPDGGDMALYQHDQDFTIRINGQELMSSRQHESEQELARLGCAHLSDRKAPNVLIGGLGMGFTLRQSLEMLGPDARVVVSELLADVVSWNRLYFRELNGQSLEDKRTEIITGDILPLISQSKGVFDAILLDVDNGPHWMTDSGNDRLYSSAGIQICRRALRKQGCLSIWSTGPSKDFEQRLIRGGFWVRRYKANAYPGKHSKSHFIWVASEDETILPHGGVDPSIPDQKAPRGNRRFTQ